MKRVDVIVKSEADVRGIRTAAKETEKLGESAKKASRDLNALGQASDRTAAKTGRLRRQAKRAGDSNKKAADAVATLKSRLSEASGVIGPFAGRLGNLVALGGKLSAVILGFLGLKKAVEEFGRAQEIRRQDEAIARLTERLGVDAPKAAEIFKQAMEGDRDILRAYGRMLGETLTKQEDLSKSTGSLREGFNRLFASVGGAISRTGILQSGIESLVVAFDFWGQKLSELTPEQLKFSELMGRLPGRVRTVEQAARDLAQAKEEARDAVSKLNAEMREELRLVAEQERRKNQVLAAEEALAQAKIQAAQASGDISQEDAARLRAASAVSFRSARSLTKQHGIRQGVELREETQREVQSALFALDREIDATRRRVQAAQRFEAANARVIDIANQLESERQVLARESRPSTDPFFAKEIGAALGFRRRPSDIQSGIGRLEDLLRKALDVRSQAKAVLPADIGPLEEEERRFQEAVERRGTVREPLFETFTEAGREAASLREDLATEREVLRIQNKAESVRETARRATELSRVMDEIQQTLATQQEQIQRSVGIQQTLADKIAETNRKLREQESRAAALRE